MSAFVETVARRLTSAVESLDPRLADAVDADVRRAVAEVSALGHGEAVVLLEALHRVYVDALAVVDARRDALSGALVERRAARRGIALYVASS